MSNSPNSPSSPNSPNSWRAGGVWRVGGAGADVADVTDVADVADATLSVFKVILQMYGFRALRGRLIEETIVVFTHVLKKNAMRDIAFFFSKRM